MAGVTTVETAAARERNASALAWLGTGSVLAATSAIVTLLVTGNPLASFVVFLGVAGATFVASRIGIRGTAGAVLVVLVAPGALGESSFGYSLVGALGLLAICITYRTDSKPGSGGAILVGGLIGLPALGMAFVFGAPVAGIFAIAAVVGVMALRRRKFAVDLLGGLTWVLGAFAASFVLTYLLGQFGSPLQVFNIGGRGFQLHLPFTVTTGGEPFIPGTRRMSPLTGEPGLAVFFVVPLVALMFSPTVTKPRRAWAAVVTVAVMVFSQSLAGVFAVAVAVLLGLLAILWRKRRFVLALVIASAAVVVAPAIVRTALSEKATVAAASFTDRGIADLGSASAAVYGNINLLSALNNSPVLAIALIAALLLGGLFAFRTLGGAVSFIAFTVVAVVAQPSQWHPGAWLLLALGVIVSMRASRT